MDADTSPTRQPAAARGGTVEPTSVPKGSKNQGPELEASAIGERYELRDPFAEVTYRAKTWQEITTKATELGSARFTAVADDGRRTVVEKVDGQWQRGPQRPPAPERPLDPGPARGDVPEATNVVPMPVATMATAHPEHADTKSSAKQVAQAERAELVMRLEAALTDRYVIKRAPVSIGSVSIGHTEYRFRGDTSRVAFTESNFKLATDTNSPSIARSMVDVAQTRGWKALRVSGNEDFRRLVWLEAQIRGVKTVGYEPNVADLEILRREREARQVNRIEPTHDAGSAPAAPAEKGSARGSGGRKAILAAIEAVLVAKHVPQKQREAVMSVAMEKLAQSTRAGQAPKVKVYDHTAPSQRTVPAPVPEAQRSRDRAAPAHTR